MTTFENEIESRGYIVYPNVGDSMMPLLRENRDLMVIRKIAAPLKKNDAVLFKRPNGAYVLHRIIKVCGNGCYRIVGDGAETFKGVIELKNESARFMFEKLQEGITLPELIRACMEEYDDSVEAVGPKVMEFLDRLREKDLLTADLQHGIKVED